MGHRSNKYGNKKTTIGSITYDSKLEAERTAELALLQITGEISDLQRQVKFELLPKQKDERSVSYIADFVYTENNNTVVEDVKSEATAKDKAYILKRKLFKWRYPHILFRET